MLWSESRWPAETPMDSQPVTAVITAASGLQLRPAAVG